MGIETTLLAASVAIGAASTGFSIISSNKARKDQKKARNLEAQRDQVAERRRRRQEIRQQRIQAARVQNFAAATGTNASSGPQGGLTSLSSQLGSSQGFASQIAGLNQGISFFNQRAADRIGFANTISSAGNFLSGAIGTFGPSFFGGSGGGGGSRAPTSSPIPVPRPI